MSSSRSSVSRTITFTRKNGNFSSFISCDKGDVYVDYMEDGKYGDDNYSPLFSVDNPRDLELNIMNSMGIDFQTTEVKWFVNGDNVTEKPGLTEIYEIRDNGLTLRIKGSIAAASLNQSITIVAEAKVRYAETEFSFVRASYYIPVRQTSGNVWHVTIAAVDQLSNYTMKNDAGSIDVKCLVFDPKGVEQDPSKYKYVWYKMVAGAWQMFSNNNNTNAAGDVLTIYRDDVDNQALFKVEAFAAKAGGGYETTPIGMDTQVIYDAMDDYSLLVTPSKDEEIEQDSGDSIDYVVSIFNVTENRNAIKAKVSFYLHAWGELLVKSATDLRWENAYQGEAADQNDPDKYGPKRPMFTVTETDFTDNGVSSLALDITAEITKG